MPDYFLAEHLPKKLGVTADELADFERRGVIKAVSKNGRRYYSAQDWYRLKAVLHFIRAEGLSLEKARFRLGGVVSPAGR